MQNKKEKKGIGKAHVYGALTLLICALAILAVIFVPMMKESRQFRKQLDLLIEGDYLYLTVSDPLFETESLLGEKGAEALLTATEIKAVREALTILREAGFRNGENEEKVGGAWDMRLQLIREDGTRTVLYFTDEACYFVEGYGAYPFYPKDEGAYSVFLDLLVSYLEEKD